MISRASPAKLGEAADRHQELGGPEVAEELDLPVIAPLIAAVGPVADLFGCVREQPMRELMSYREADAGPRAVGVEVDPRLSLDEHETSVIELVNGDDPNPELIGELKWVKGRSVPPVLAGLVDESSRAGGDDRDGIVAARQLPNRRIRPASLSHDRPPEQEDDSGSAPLTGASAPARRNT